jgi:hypothetical protein
VYAELRPMSVNKVAVQLHVYNSRALTSSLCFFLYAELRPMSVNKVAVQLHVYNSHALTSSMCFFVC